MTRVLWVWEDTPPDVWPAGYDQAVVKGFDGRALRSPAGFGWMDNFHAWQVKHGAHRVAMWGVPYPQDGAELGAMIEPNAHGCPYVVLDVEDFNGAVWTETASAAVVHGFRGWGLGVALGYSTYPTREQCAQHNIDQAWWDQTCDLSFPQVYYDYQAAKLLTVWEEHRHPHITVSPANYGWWQQLARDAEGRSGAVAFWRMGVAGWEGWGMDVPQQQQPAPVPVAGDDPLKPTHWEKFPGGVFLAWDGTAHWTTDLIWRQVVEPGDVPGMVHLGVQVRWWPSVVRQTTLAH